MANKQAQSRKKRKAVPDAELRLIKPTVAFQEITEVDVKLWLSIANNIWNELLTRNDGWELLSGGHAEFKMDDRFSTSGTPSHLLWKETSRHIIRRIANDIFSDYRLANVGSNVLFDLEYMSFLRSPAGAKAQGPHWDTETDAFILFLPMTEEFTPTTLFAEQPKCMEELKSLLLNNHPSTFEALEPKTYFPKRRLCLYDSYMMNTRSLHAGPANNCTGGNSTLARDRGLLFVSLRATGHEIYRGHTQLSARHFIEEAFWDAYAKNDANNAVQWLNHKFVQWQDHFPYETYSKGIKRFLEKPPGQKRHIFSSKGLVPIA